jgi:iron complex outermembrane receptor protein
MGFEVDGEFLVTDRPLLTAGFSYVDTEIEDDQLTVRPCGATPDNPTTPLVNERAAPFCTVRDPLVPDPADAQAVQARINGNPFPQAPEYIATITARYGVPVGDSGEFFIYTDWAYQARPILHL